MQAILISKVYKYNTTTLGSGHIVSASSVTIVDGKVANIHGKLHPKVGSSHPDEIATSFSARITKDGTYNYTIENGNTDINGVDVITEFIDFIENDII